MTTLSRRLAARALYGLLCATLLLCASFIWSGKLPALGMTANAQAPTPYPTEPSYYCPTEDWPLYFTWTKRMPYGGWLGKEGSLPIQVYDPRPTSYGGTSWGFQAQNGSFVCRMQVSSDKGSISFNGCRTDIWPYTECLLLTQP